MRDYGLIHTCFWSSANVLGLSDDAKLLALYLISSPHTNMLGCFRLPYAYVQEDLRWSAERVSKGFEELFRNSFGTYDKYLQWIVLHNFIKWNPIENPNQAIKAARLFDQIPDKTLVKPILARILIESGKHINEPFRNRLITVSEPFRNQEQEPEQEPEQLQEQENQEKTIVFSVVGNADDGPDGAIQTKNQTPPVTDQTSATSPTSRVAIPDCPKQDLIACYAQRLPMLSQPRLWDGAREQLMRSRWRYCATANGVSKGYATKAEGIAFWERYFSYVAKSRKLTEGIPYEDGRLWKPDLEWLLKAANFMKVVEGKYHD